MLKEQIDKDYIEAYKSKDEAKTSLLRMIKSAIKNAEIANKSQLSDAEVIKILQRESKQRNEAITDYNAGGRPDLVKKEQNEIELLKNYLPKELTDQELSDIVTEAIATTGATSPADFGKVMGATMPKIAGRATGDRVLAVLKNILR